MVSPMSSFDAICEKITSCVRSRDAAPGTPQTIRGARGRHYRALSWGYPIHVIECRRTSH